MNSLADESAVSTSSGAPNSARLQQSPPSTRILSSPSPSQSPTPFPIPGIEYHEFKYEVAVMAIFRGENPYVCTVKVAPVRLHARWRAIRSSSGRMCVAEYIGLFLNPCWPYTPHRVFPRYLEEWLEYHMLIGVQHFFFMSNECDTDEAEAAKALLQPYIHRGVVSLSYKCAHPHPPPVHLLLRTILPALIHWIVHVGFFALLRRYKCASRFQGLAYIHAYSEVLKAKQARWYGGART